MEKQALLSGLGVLECGNVSDSNKWPPLLGGWRCFHASVGIDHEDVQDDSDEKIQSHTIAVLGGKKQNEGETSSVILLKVQGEENQWVEGPSMNDKRFGHAAVVCNGHVYVIGGHDETSGLDSMERIPIENLLYPTSTTSINHDICWTKLKCRLSTKRIGCTAAVLKDRFIVVVGGWRCRSIDIVDTAMDGSQPVWMGTRLRNPRQYSGMAVVSDRIYVVGGLDCGTALRSVEYLDLGGRDVEGLSDDELWQYEGNLQLSAPRSNHAVVQVGQCLVVAGGSTGENPVSSVEVLDTARNMVWEMSNHTIRRCDCATIATPKGILVTGGDEFEQCKIIPLVDKKEQLKVCLLPQFFCQSCAGLSFSCW